MGLSKGKKADPSHNLPRHPPKKIHPPAQGNYKLLVFGWATEEGRKEGRKEGREGGRQEERKMEIKK